jgi:5'-nucleotidase
LDGDRIDANSCQGAKVGTPVPFEGAKFQWLSANVVVTATGQTLLPAYGVKRFEGVPVAFIGMTLKDTPGIVVPTGVAGLEFRDEADTVNRLVPELRRQGVEAIVVLIHEGGIPAGDYNECPGISGAIVGIVERLDPAVDLVVSGHTHRAYNCRIAGRLVTSGDKYGTLVTAIDLTLDPRSGDVVASHADNVIVREALAPDARLTRLIEQYEALAQPLARRVVGRLAAALPRDSNAAGENALGQVIADAQLAATTKAGAQIALMNPGGIRAPLPLPADGLVRYEDLFSVQPFYNNLVTVTLSGAQLAELLEQQWAGQAGDGRVLQVSRGFGYTWDASRPAGQRVLAGSLLLNGQPLDPAARVRVTANHFLAGGGDSFPLLQAGTDRQTGIMDVDALEDYVREHPGLAPGPLDRIRRLH